MAQNKGGRTKGDTRERPMSNNPALAEERNSFTASLLAPPGHVLLPLTQLQVVGE